VIVTHFHLDHCGALPLFTEGEGFNGPVVATPPTKAILPLMLEDFRKVSSNQKGGIDAFNQDMIKVCLSKVQTIQLHETMVFYPKDEQLGEIKVTAYYAGHVLGAAMFSVECNGEKLVYTGDFNMTADRHLGSAWIEKL
jgi:integrator complex subunit 11